MTLSDRSSSQNRESADYAARAAMQRCPAVVLCLITVLMIVTLAARATPADVVGAVGLNSEGERVELDIEQQFSLAPDESSARQNHATLTARPHVAGSPGDRRVVDFLVERLRGYGLEPTVESESATLSLPRRVGFKLLGHESVSGPRPESEAGDRDVLPPFNAFSGSGRVTTEVVYANYGTSGDYEYLRSVGVSVHGKIVLVRYGAAYRGVKAMLAEQHGAVALVVFSDPQDDGYHKGDVYPAGPWRPASGVQRGSTLYEFLEPGVLRPHRGNAPRIPVLSISSADARPIVHGLSGLSAPSAWQGGLPFTYHIGPGPSRLAINVDMEEYSAPIWNVVVKIQGIRAPDEIVLLGTHHDAWVYGGVDPDSAVTSLLEVAKGLGALLRSGWHPGRSIWICFWDGEEFGEFGSVAWAKKHAAALEKGAVAYLDADSVAGGAFFASTVPSLRSFVINAAQSVPDPAGGSVLDRATATLRADSMIVALADDTARPDSNPTPITQRTFEPGYLGGGTDFLAFFNHLGIPSVLLGFDGDYGVYHSVFDNHDWMERFGDPQFRYHVAAARLLGLIALRLANAEVLPFDYETYGHAIRGYLSTLAQRAVILGRPALDIGAADRAAAEFAEAGAQLGRYSSAVRRTDVLATARVNTSLIATERSFLLPDGLPGREWYRHAIFAPGLYSGYEAVVLPAVREAIDAGRSTDAQRGIDAVTEALTRATASLRAGLE